MSEVVVRPDAETLASTIAARLLAALGDAQTARGTASVVLTGGGLGGRVLEAVNTSPARSDVDWKRVDFWWGDERFLPAGDPERNDTLADTALLAALDVDPARVHRVSTSDGEYGDDPDAAAEAYAREIGAARFDVLLLGVGEEGHVASIFPESPAAHEKERAVVAVRDCPKPPPTRISLTFPTIGRAEQVWLCTAGAAKADAVAKALGGADPLEVPAAGARGTARTIWLIDEAAAAGLASR
ncbi:MAG TPA: 6-phosphogluconolactonase [Mycobacteriales bacterium]|nr:6-phosphogluconolactonase [Mycobacteriales bacterium]